MNHARLIFEDTPAFVPVPRELQHRKTEVIFKTLDGESTIEASADLQNVAVKNEASDTTQTLNMQELNAFLAALPKIDVENPPLITDLIGKAPSCFKSAAEVDAFIRAERDAWDD